MRRYSAVLLCFLLAGCAIAAPPTPEVVATQPVAPQPVVSEPAPTTAAKPAQAAPKRAAPVASAPKPGVPPVTASRVATAASPALPAAGPALDLDGLKARLRATKAIGVFTKLSLKNKVDDLMKQFTEHYQGKSPPIAELRQSYDLLMLKVLSLLQDSDQPLASAIVSSREAIWALLADQKKFAALQS